MYIVLVNIREINVYKHTAMSLNDVVHYRPTSVLSKTCLVFYVSLC